MLCKYRKFKISRGTVEFVSGDSSAHFSKKRCRLYHKNLQKKQIAFHNDCLSYTIVDGKDICGDDICEDVEIGINKDVYGLDGHDGFDIYKD